jgi:cytochrome c-type biogenesis protein CcmH/NrfF
VAQCNSKTAIKTELVAQFGPSVLAEPPHHGFDVTAYLVPALGFAFGAAGIASIGLAWRRRGGRGPAHPTPPALSAADRERVDVALEHWDP